MFRDFVDDSTSVIKDDRICQSKGSIDRSPLDIFSQFDFIFISRLLSKLFVLLKSKPTIDLEF